MDKILGNQMVSPRRGRKSGQFKIAALAIIAALIVGTSAKCTWDSASVTARQSVIFEQFVWWYQDVYNEHPSDAWQRDGGKSVDAELSAFGRNTELQAEVARRSGIGLPPAEKGK